MAGRRIPKGQPRTRGTENVSSGTQLEVPGTTAVSSNEPDEPRADLNAGYDEHDTEPESIEPESIGTTTDTGSGTRKRGRRKGSRNKPNKETAQDLTGLLLGIHQLLAMQVEEMEIDEDEAKKLAVAIERVNSLYGGYVLPEKTMAWISLAMAAGSVYAPRIVAIRENHKNKKAEEPGKPVAVPPGPVVLDATASYVEN